MTIGTGGISYIQRHIFTKQSVPGRPSACDTATLLFVAAEPDRPPACLLAVNRIFTRQGVLSGVQGKGEKRVKGFTPRKPREGGMIGGTAYFRVLNRSAAEWNNSK